MASKSKKEKNKEKFLKHKKEIIREIMHGIAYEQRKAAEKICEKAVDKFYADYTPHMYSRKGSLYEAYNLEIKPNGEFIFELGSEFMTKGHRVSNEYIYEKMFQLGWHGGADDGEGHPDEQYPVKQRRLFWRQPPYDVIDVDDYGDVTDTYIKKWSLWDTKPAKQMSPYDGSLAPYQTIKREWAKYLKNEYDDMTLQIMDSVFKKYLGG